MIRCECRGPVLTRVLVASLFAVATTMLLVQTTEARAVSKSVERACKRDWSRYCSAHSPGTTTLRSCMRANGKRLTRRCVNALVRAGEVSRREVRRYYRRKRRR